MTTVEMSTAEETTCSLIEQMNVEMEVEVKIESDWTDYECFEGRSKRIRHQTQKYQVEKIEKSSVRKVRKGRVNYESMMEFPKKKKGIKKSPTVSTRLKRVSKCEHEDGNEILGATTVAGKLEFLFRIKGDSKLKLIPSNEANVKYPYTVMNFYEKHIEWLDGDNNFAAVKV